MNSSLASLCKIACKMLLHSRKKFVGMLIGATFSAFILIQQPAIYKGVCDRIVAQITAISEVDLWVMDKRSGSFEQPYHFDVMDLYRIRSIPGVTWAMPLYRMWYPLQHLKSQKTMGWELIGVDPHSLIGLPTALIAGSREAIHQAHGVIIDGYSLKQYESKNNKTIKLGDKLEATDKQIWEVSGISKPLRTYSLEPKVYIASNHIPNVQAYPSFILVKVKDAAVLEVARRIDSKLNFDALTPQEFVARSIDFFSKHTPIVINFIAVAVFGFIIGLIMMWQIFNNFILTNIHQFGMLKMLGVNNKFLMVMVVLQAAITGGLGYVFGLIYILIFGLIVHDTVIAFHMTYKIAMLGAVGTVLNILCSAYFGIRRILRMDSIELCRDLN